MSEATKRALLKRAVEALGIGDIGARLRAPATLVEAWLHGHATIPDRKYSQLVDIVASLIDTPKPRS